MKLAIIILMALLVLGCTGERGSQANSSLNITPNETGNLSTGNATANVTPLNMTANLTNSSSSGYARFIARSFSFKYPPGMGLVNSTDARGGSFTGTYQSANRTIELLAVVYANTSATYGYNADYGFQADPGIAAGKFLEDDRANDTTGYLHNATELGQTTTYARGRDVFVAEAPFTAKMSNLTYAGYALSMYVPSRSLEVQARILALDPDVARQMRDDFLLSFRVE